MTPALTTDRAGRTPLERIADFIARLRDGAFDWRQGELRLELSNR